MTAIEKVNDAIEAVGDAAEIMVETNQEVPGRGGMGLAAAALLLGAGLGSGVAYFLLRRQLETKYSAKADAEIEEMRTHYLAKGRALEAEKGKGDLGELVKEKGYVSTETEKPSGPPMAVQPPQSVMESEDTAAGESTDDSAMAENDVEGANGIKARGEDAVRNVFRDHGGRPPIPEWDEHAERRRRSPDRPYVIHKDEVNAMEGYDSVSMTYYAKDDVLCDETDEIMDPERRDDVVGEANLDRFGHGSSEPEIVYIRNDGLEIVYEIVRSENSYAEEVHGFKHEDWDRGNLERMRRRERDHGED